MIYLLGNWPQPTTAAPSPVNTSSHYTLLQFKPIIPGRVIEWGFSANGDAAATPGVLELLETTTVAATVTQYNSGDVSPMDAEALNAGDPGGLFLTYSTTGSGYTSSGEGTITGSRYLAAPQQIAPTNQYLQPLPLGQEGFFQAGKIYRIRATFGTPVGALVYVKLSFGGC